MNARRLFSTGLLVAMSALLFAGAYALDVFGPTLPAEGGTSAPSQSSQRQAASPDAGPLVFDEPAVNLGAAKGTVSQRFTYTNAGDKPLTITKTTPSCACAVSQPDRTTLRPGESGSVTLEVDLSQKGPGPHRFHLSIEYECGGGKRAVATLRVAHQPDLHVTPRRLEMIVTEGGRTSAQLSVIDYRKESLKVLSIRSSSPGLGAKVKERPSEYLPGWRHTIDVTWADPPGEAREEFLERILIDTSDPAHPVLAVDVTVRRLDRLRLAPRSVRLSPGRPTVVIIRDSLGKKVVVAGCDPAGLAVPSFTPEPEAAKRVSLSLPGGAVDPAKYPATVWIRVTKPCERRLPVTVSLDQP